MSLEDWDRDAVLSQAFVGCVLYCALPTNSIKLMLDLAQHRQGYIWIDPPWELFSGDGLVTSGGEYPNHELPDYPALHKAWGAVVMPLLNAAVLEGVGQLDGGLTEFRFRGAVRLQVGGGEPQGWYDDWYVKPHGDSVSKGGRP